jgi:hypothetical protein
MVNVRISGNQNDVAAIPAKLIHLFTGHWQKRCRPKTGGPILRPGEQVAIRLDQGDRAHFASKKKSGKKIIKGRGLYAVFVGEMKEIVA